MQNFFKKYGWDSLNLLTGSVIVYSAYAPNLFLCHTRLHSFQQKFSTVGQGLLPTFGSAVGGAGNIGGVMVEYVSSVYNKGVIRYPPLS